MPVNAAPAWALLLLLCCCRHVHAPAAPVVGAEHLYPTCSHFRLTQAEVRMCRSMAMCVGSLLRLMNALVGRKMLRI